MLWVVVVVVVVAVEIGRHECQQADAEVLRPHAGREGNLSTKPRAHTVRWIRLEGDREPEPSRVSGRMDSTVRERDRLGLRRCGFGMICGHWAREKIQGSKVQQGTTEDSVGVCGFWLADYHGAAVAVEADSMPTRTKLLKA